MGKPVSRGHSGHPSSGIREWLELVSGVSIDRVREVMERDDYDKQLIQWVKNHYWDSLEKDKHLILRHLRTFASDINPENDGRYPFFKEIKRLRLEKEIADRQNELASLQDNE